jgi:signal transduction histidine kinase/CheY-like chemotaxis protein/HPt (histidine-containing phosphotransfer) domain-containing protein
MGRANATRRLLTAFAGLLAAGAGAGLLLAPELAPWHWLVLSAGMVASGAAWPRNGGEAGDGAGGTRRRSGEEVRELRAELEQHKRLEEELLSAKQAAEAAMMSKGEFLATMSHEIRTPLNGIIPLLDILLTSPLAPDQRDYVQTAFASARQLLRIVDDILDYSKLDANKLELENVGLNLREVLESVVRLMEKSAESKGLRLELQIDPAVRLAARGDPVRLRQILTNLVSNAIKFTERGTVTVALLRRGITATHHELRFEVRDTGIGIPAAAAVRLFQPFSQADTSTTRTFGGTGLGLVICKRIVDLMGGQIGVESEPGRGSMFWVNLSLMKALGDMGSAPAPRTGGLQGMRALVLTSDPALMRRFSVALPNWGLTPVPASNTQEALNKLRLASSRGEGLRIDLLLVDLNSVRSTAIGLHRNVLRESSLADLRIVYLTGDDPVPAELAAGERVQQVPRSVGDADLRMRLDRLVRQGTPGPGPAAPAIRVVEAAAPGDAPAPRDSVPIAGHVLLVEDNAVNRQVAQRLLTLLGISQDCAENGAEAIDKLQTGRYSAVLMDCQMPVMDGYTATRERRRLEDEQALPRIPIIAMTANAMIGDREKCLESGMDDYLSKPLNRALLEQTLRRWIEPEPAPAPSAVAPPAVSAANKAPAAAVRPSAMAGLAARPAVASGKPAVNREIVQDLRDIMGEEFPSLVRVFLEDAPRALARLQEAAASGDIDSLVGPAHSLKSTSANLGAMEMSAQAKHIEHGARARTLTDAPDRAAALLAEFDRVEAALQEWL